MVAQFGNRQDEEAIRASILETLKGFNSHDAKLATQAYMAESDLVTVRGDFLAYNNPQRLPEYVFRELTGAPVLIQGGELDTYDEPDSCQKLVDSLPEASRPVVRLKMYPGATHKFDATEPEHTIKVEPGANQGRGGEVRVTPNPAVGEMARDVTAKFFVEVFGLGK